MFKSVIRRGVRLALSEEVDAERLLQLRGKFAQAVLDLKGAVVDKCDVDVQAVSTIDVSV